MRDIFAVVGVFHQRLFSFPQPRNRSYLRHFLVFCGLPLITGMNPGATTSVVPMALFGYLSAAARYPHGAGVAEANGCGGVCGVKIEFVN